MSKTIVGLFHGADEAQHAVRDLKREGLSQTQTFGTAGGGGITGVKSRLTQAGIPQDEADTYADEIERGGTLVLVRTEDNRAQRAVEIMERHGTPGAGAGMETRSTRGTASGAMPGRGAGETTEPEVQEELRVGKRPVERTGVRISTHISEQPVEEQVRLHEEKVNVERRAADRPASEADLRKGDRDVVVTERTEEPVIQKEARVTGEVAVSKESRERTETVRDKVRRKEVHVDRQPGTAAPAYTQFEAEFREHHRKHDKSGMDYADAAPAYRYGLDLAHSNRFKNKDWSSIKSDIRGDWEKYNPDTWDEAEPAIKFGWEKGRAK